MVNSISGIGGTGNTQPREQKMPPEIRQQLLAAGATEEQIAAAGTPEKDQALASQLGITLTMPTPPSGAQDSNTFAQTMNNTQQQSQPSMEDIIAELTALGIPESTIQQGPEAVRAYAEKAGITLPTPDTNTLTLTDTNTFTL